MKLLTLTRPLIAAALVAAAPVALPDDLYVRSGARGAELPLKNVTIRGIRDGKLLFLINQRESQRDIADVSRIELTGEDALNAAEKAFAEASGTEGDRARAKFAEAVTGYQTTLNSTNKPWLRDFVSARLQVAAPRSGRFDAAIASWLNMARQDPAAAGKNKPSLEGVDPKSTYLAQAVNSLQAALGDADAPEQKRAYLDLLADVQHHMGDLEGAAKTAEQRVQLGGNPEEIAAVTLQLAQIDLGNKRYQAAADRLAKLDLGTLPDGPRADALWVLAESRAATLKDTAPPDQLKDLAIDYMRVVALPGAPHVPAALLKVAQLHEALKDSETALKIYQQVAREHPDTPAAQAARQRIDRLSKGASPRN